MRNHIMLDLETMGSGPNSAIVAIGAVRFNAESVLDKFSINIDLKSCTDIGLKIDSETVIWWLEQSKEAQNLLVDGMISSISLALKSFNDWIGENAEIWGHGAGFDNVILRQACKAARVIPAWNYRSDRCYRTIAALYPDIKRVNIGTYHRAIDDAESQALHLIEICKHHHLPL